MHRYQLRSTHQYIVKVYNIAIDSYSSVCTSNQNALLLVEHIPLRLIDLRSLDLQESLTVLHSAFRGFHTIESLFQLVEPSEDLICFNEQGKTKVWLNHQLNQNFLRSQKKAIDLHQFSRVAKIVEMVQKKHFGSAIFQSLIKQIYQSNVNYFEASIIVEQFAFKQQLSLKRYVRTDLLTRQAKSETHRRNTTTSTIFPNDTSNLHFARKSDIFIPTNQLQKIKSWDRLPAFQCNNTSRRTAFGIATLGTSKSIPKITFNSPKPTDRPLILQNNQPKIIFSSPRPQQRVSFLSPTNAPLPTPTQSSQPQKIQQPVAVVKKQQQVTQKLSKETVKNQQQSLNQQKQVLPTKPQKKVKIAHTIDILSPNEQENEVKAQLASQNIPQILYSSPQRQRSIIDECQKYLQSSKLSSEVQQQAQQTLPMIHNSSDVQESGMFRQVVYQQPKQSSPQIAQLLQQDTNTPNPYAQRAITLHLQSKIKQIPINFQSFAAQKLMLNQNVSFAPKLGLQHIEEKGIAQTSKSVEWQKEQQNEQDSLVQSEDCESNLEVEQPPKKSFRLVESQQRVQNKPGQVKEKWPAVSNEYAKLIGQNRISLELQQQFSAIGREEKPFYEDYTPVESKFDIMIKKDSLIDRDKQVSDHSNRLSAFGNVEDQDCYDRSIKNKLKEIFPSGDLRINRISSEYETNTKRLSQDSPREGKIQAKLNKIANINEGTEQDFLDINHLERTLQMRCSNKEKIHKKSDQFDVEKLDERLMKFSASKGHISKESETSHNQSRDTFHKSKMPSKVSQFFIEKDETYHQTRQKQAKQPKEPQKVQDYKFDYQASHELRSGDLKSSYQYRQVVSSYKPNELQRDIGERTTHKFKSNPYNQYSQTNFYKTQSNRYGVHSYLPQKAYHGYHNYTSTSYNDQYTAILPQYSKIKKSPDSLLEQRYQKYVKEGKQKPALSKQKSVQSFSKRSKWSEVGGGGESKRISYNNLREFLWS